MGSAVITSLILYDLNGNFIKQWDCILDFYKSINKTKNNSSVSSCCKGKLKTAYGYKWKYADEELQKITYNKKLTY